ANGHAQAADALLVIHHQQTCFQFVAHGFPKVFSTTVINCCTRNGFSMHGVLLWAKNACVSLFAVSPLIRIMRAHSSGRFFWIQACTSAPLTAPGMRMSEITPEYLPAVSIWRPSAPDEALATEYPWRSSAARRKAVTEGSSSISKMGAVAGDACAFIAQPLLQG